jgi:hypothetical protein
MVNFSKLAANARRAVDKAGGPDAIKEKAQKAIDKAGGQDAIKAKANEVKGIAKGKGSVSDKAKAAADVVKRDEPAASGQAAPGDGGGAPRNPGSGS